MKLTSKQVAKIRDQTGLTPVSDQAAEDSGLSRAFGDQTFYIDPNGLYVFEPVTAPSGKGDQVLAVQIATVTVDEPDQADTSEEPAEKGDSVTLQPIQPRSTQVTADLAV